MAEALDPDKGGTPPNLQNLNDDLASSQIKGPYIQSTNQVPETIKKRPLNKSADLANANQYSTRRLNMWQQMNTATNKKVQDQEQTPHHPTSTPLVSPTSIRENLSPPLNTNERPDDEMYNYMQQQESAGVTLISKPPPLPIISGDMPSPKLVEALDNIDNHIDQYGEDFSNNPNNKKKAASLYKNITAKLNQVRLICAEKENDDLLSRCSELASKLEAFKIQWSISCNNSSANTSTFDGFSSFDFMKAAANMPNSNNNARMITNLISKIKDLEGLKSSIDEIRTKVTDLETRESMKATNEGISTLEARCRTAEQLIDNLNTKYFNIEKNMEETSTFIHNQSKTCNKSAEYQRNLAKELTSYKMSTQTDLEAMQDQIDAMTASFEQPTTKLQDPMVNEPHRTPLEDAPNSERVETWLHTQVPDNQKNTSNQQPPDRPNLQEKNNQECYEPNSQDIRIQQNHIGHTNHENVISKSGNNDRDSANDDVESISSSNTQDLYAKSLKRQMRGLQRLLQPEPSDIIDKATLQDLYKNRLSLVDTERRDLQRSLRDYMRFRMADLPLCDDVENILECADKWANKLRELYISKGHHKKSQTAKLYEALPKFTPRSEIDIYEYLRRFENLTHEYEIPEEMAELLYAKHLSPSIQDEVVSVKENYNKMKLLLLQRYGDLQTITNNILSNISREVLPNTANLSTKLDFYRKLQSSIQKINKLLAIPDVNADEVEDFVFGHDFLKRLLQLLPEPAHEQFLSSMSDLDQDTKRVRGKVAFKTILTSVNKIYEKYDSMVRNVDIDSFQSSSKYRKDKDKPLRQANHVGPKEDDSTDSSIDTDGEPVTNVHFQDKLKKEKSVSSRKFPCTIIGHKHSLSDCVEFYLKTPKERVEVRREIKFKHCTLCLQSNNECRYKKCSNYKSVPKTLVCGECRELFKTRKKACYSIFFCINDKHTKPSNSEILLALEQYITGFKSSLLNAPINLACHFQVLGGMKNQTSIDSLSSPVDPNQLPPIFDTSTGDQVDTSPVDLINEVDEDCIGVMQILSIGGKNMLTLYDRGANQNLINGQIAESLNIKVHQREQSSIGVISGNRILTGYGTYELYLGPTTSGKYHQIIAQGMRSITGKFPKYHLDEVNRESLEHADIHPSTPLPSYVGGDCIDLLIGLKDANLEPVCVFNLPSGIGLYRSPFKDAFGSFYCYGGPHRIFSEVHRSLAGNVNHMYSFFSEIINEYKASPFFSLKLRLQPELIDTGYGICQYKENSLPHCYQSTSSLHVYPSPLSDGDLEDLGIIKPKEHDPESDDCPLFHCNCPEFSVAMKAKVPLNKQRIYLDEEDKDEIINFRCDKCLKCKCAASNTTRMISISEQVEQEAVEKSVTVDLETKSVYVDLPFTKDPGEYLTAKHGANNNYHQSFKVYLSQCRLQEPKKVEIRKVVDDLKARGFLKKLSELPAEQQQMIQNSPFQHYMCWRTVAKDSESTPLRIVVDPSMSGLNLILAKGENRIKKITDILIRSRVRKFSWSSDITKLYNCLKLKPTSYAYQLFLYDDKLDPNKPPEVHVLVVAWYGVSSSSNQAIFALEELARLLQDDFPLAFTILTEEIYVDDILSGSNSEKERDQQIHEVQSVLESGGFKVKYVIKSGVPSEGRDDSIKVLGYTWKYVEDKLGLGFMELNFNKKKRGMKLPNPFPVSTLEDVSKLLQDFSISRRVVISKIAEIWEPLGLWEPYKVQLKLASRLLNESDWDKPLGPDIQEYWLQRFHQFLDLPKLSVNRYIFPDNKDPHQKIRLICLSDAASNCGGAAIYAGIQLDDNSFSCQLIASRSKLMSHSIPRNELESIRIAATLAYEAKNTLGENVGEVLFFTDSSIALSWCHNTKKKLRMFVLNRVSEIRRVISSITNDDILPLYHIESSLNTADLLTKPSNLKPTDLHSESAWISGLPWMKTALSYMPLSKYSDLQLSAQQKQMLNQECFPDIILPSQIPQPTSPTTTDDHCNGCTYFTGCITRQVCYGNSIESLHCNECSCTNALNACQVGNGVPLLVDIIHHGYSKSLRILAFTIDFIWSTRHKAHLSRGVQNSQDCKKCKALEECSGISLEYSKILKHEALNYYLRQESNRLQKILPKEKLSKFHLVNGMLFMSGRLPDEAEISTKDLDFKVFFDNTDIRGTLPVVSAESDLFYALLMDIHHRIRKHAGIEITLREINKTIFPINNARRIIQIVRRSCPRCRLLLRKTLELSIGNHPASKLQICPAFYHCMADICYGFKGKPHRNARNPTLKIYALVIVCLLTSATNILALESLETQEVVMALERHSARYGAPSAIFVDNGTQLTSLSTAEFDIRDANNQLRESIGLEIIPSTAKAHEERGKVERKIKTLREMLIKASVNTDIALTPLQWETLFQKLAAEIDEVPIARMDEAADNDLGWELLTPNRFKLGRSNYRSIEGVITISPTTGPVSLLRKIQDIQVYWYQLLLDRLHHLIPSNSNWTRTDAVKLGDIIVFRLKDNTSSKLEKWSIGKVSEIQKNGRRILCSYPTATPDGAKVKWTSVPRSPRDICIISAASDIPMNSHEFFNKIKKLT